MLISWIEPSKTLGPRVERLETANSSLTVRFLTVLSGVLLSVPFEKRAFDRPYQAT